MDALREIVSSLTPEIRSFLLRAPHPQQLHFALSTPPKTHVHTIATQTATHPLPDSTTQTLYHTLPSSNLGFQIITRSSVQATFRTFRDDEKGMFLRVANYDDMIHIACTQRVSGAARRSYQAFLDTEFQNPTFVFQVVEIGTCPTCLKRELCSCPVTGYDGVFEGIGRAIWYDKDNVVDVVTRSHVIETCDIPLAKTLQQWAFGDAMATTPVLLSRLAMPCKRQIVPAGGSAEQVVAEMQTRYQEETRRKIEERKMRNRRAAVQSNVKKKKYIEGMREVLRELREKKECLQKREGALREENGRLRMLLREREEGRDLLEEALVFE